LKNYHFDNLIIKHDNFLLGQPSHTASISIVHNTPACVNSACKSLRKLFTWLKILSASYTFRTPYFLPPNPLFLLEVIS